jgi:hypothetical protein
MSEKGKSPTTMSTARRRAVREYLLQHPFAKDPDVVLNFKGHVGLRTIRYVRSQLVLEGLIPESRVARNRRLSRLSRAAAEITEGDAPPATAPAPIAYTGQLLTPDTVQAMAEAVGDGEDLESDPETQRRMTREAKRMAFDTNMPAESRMAAMKLWIVLRDALKTHDLGPGRPVSYETAKVRGLDLFRAMGMPLVLDCALTLWGEQLVRAIIELFGHKESPDEATDDKAPTALGTQEAPGPPGHEGAPAEAQDLRQEHSGLGPVDALDQQHNDLHGPEEGRPGPASNP